MATCMAFPSDDIQWALDLDTGSIDCFIALEIVFTCCVLSGCDSLVYVDICWPLVYLADEFGINQGLFEAPPQYSGMTQVGSFHPCATTTPQFGSFLPPGLLSAPPPPLTFNSAIASQCRNRDWYSNPAVVHSLLDSDGSRPLSHDAPILFPGNLPPLLPQQSGMYLHEGLVLGQQLPAQALTAPTLHIENFSRNASEIQRPPLAPPAASLMPTQARGWLEAPAGTLTRASSAPSLIGGVEATSPQRSHSVDFGIGMPGGLTVPGAGESDFSSCGSHTSCSEDERDSSVGSASRSRRTLVPRAGRSKMSARETVGFCLWMFVECNSSFIFSMRTNLFILNIFKLLIIRNAFIDGKNRSVETFRMKRSLTLHFPNGVSVAIRITKR